MALRINLNIASLLAQRGLERNTVRLNRALAELSSGTRINRAGDDAAGLAISQLLTSQARSTGTAIRNSADGESVINTAEAALASIQGNMQRVRELAIQAANDTLSTENRVAIQTEIDALVEEIDRVAQSTTFNGKNLLDGTFLNQRLQIGSASGDFLPVSIPNVSIGALGQVALVTGNSPVSTTPIAGGGDLVINGIAVPASTADGTSFVAADASAIAKANAINSVATQTGVTATAEPAVFQEPGATISGITLDGTSSGTALLINDVNIGVVNVLPGDSDGALVNAINAQSDVTGVTASVAATGELVLESADGATFEIDTIGPVSDALGLSTSDANFTDFAVTGKITLRSNETIEVAGTDPSLIGFDGSQAVTMPTAATSVEAISVVTQADAEEAIGFADSTLRQLSLIRASLGAIANRLTANQASLASEGENLRASNSRIRDTDFADATARLAREQILQQAATAILAQANLLPEQALSLLER